MSEMVERVALAIWQAREKRMGIDRTTRMEPDAIDRASGAWAATMAEARAAIEAIRDFDFADSSLWEYPLTYSDGFGGMRPPWKEVLDAALKP